MPFDFLPDIPFFAREAVVSFESIMDNAHKEQREGLNRVNKGELFVLKHLYHQKEPTTPSELSSALQSSMARISSILKSLEEKGHIERRIDLHDRRNILVTLTTEGSDRIATEMNHRRHELAKVFTAMGESHTKEFIRLLWIFSKAMACADLSEI